MRWLGLYDRDVAMIIYWLGLALKAMFDLTLVLLRTVFGTLWVKVGEKIAAVLDLSGVGVGLGLLNTFIGIDFIVWATGLAVAIVITMVWFRAMRGLVSRA